MMKQHGLIDEADTLARCSLIPLTSSIQQSRVMKSQLRKLASPLLNLFERGEEPYLYKPINRTILIATSLLFTLLALVVLWVALRQGDMSYLLPAVVFGSVALTGLVVGTLGNERAVAKIWGNK
jgi:hypothetical protein